MSTQRRGGATTRKLSAGEDDYAFFANAAHKLDTVGFEVGSDRPRNRPIRVASETSSCLLLDYRTVNVDAACLLDAAIIAFGSSRCVTVLHVTQVRRK